MSSDDSDQDDENDLDESSSASSADDGEFVKDSVNEPKPGGETEVNGSDYYSEEDDDTDDEGESDSDTDEPKAKRPRGNGMTGVSNNQSKQSPALNLLKPADTSRNPLLLDLDYSAESVKEKRKIKSWVEKDEMKVRSLSMVNYTHLFPSWPWFSNVVAFQ